MFLLIAFVKKIDSETRNKETQASTEFLFLSVCLF